MTTGSLKGPDTSESQLVCDNPRNTLLIWSFELKWYVEWVTYNISMQTQGWASKGPLIGILVVVVMASVILNWIEIKNIRVKEAGSLNITYG